MSNPLIRNAEELHNKYVEERIAVKRKDAQALCQQIEFAEAAKLTLARVEAEIEFYESQLVEIPAEEPVNEE